MSFKEDRRRILLSATESRSAQLSDSEAHIAAIEQEKSAILARLIETAEVFQEADIASAAARINGTGLTLKARENSEVSGKYSYSLSFVWQENGDIAFSSNLVVNADEYFEKGTLTEEKLGRKLDWFIRAVIHEQPFIKPQPKSTPPARRAGWAYPTAGE